LLIKRVRLWGAKPAETGNSCAGRPKVVRVIPVLDYGGVETTFVIEASSIDRKLYDYQICTFWKAGAAAEAIAALGVRVTSLEVDPSVRNPLATIKLAQFLRQQRPHIVHSSIGEANFHSAIAAKLAGVPVSIIEEQGIPNRKLGSRIVHAGVYRMVNAIVGVSRASCDVVVRDEWAPPERVHLIYNAASRAYFSPLAPKHVGSEFHFISVGRLVPEKNHETIIRAFSKIAARLPHARLTIVGDGELSAFLSALVAQLGLMKQVYLPGYSSDILDLLDKSDAFLIPSRSEGFGIAAVEAMARGVPVIASDAGGLPEVVGGMGDKWILRPDDIDLWAERMQELADVDAETASAMRLQSRTVAEKFTQEARANKLKELYTSLLSDFENGKKGTR
jgi:glycosyltransferase involved in cell wall biosynthesis